MKINGEMHMSTYTEVLLLRYYATFKVRKFRSLFYKLIDFCKKLPRTLDSWESKYCLKYIIYIFFQFCKWLLQFLFYFIFKSSRFLWKKNFEIIFVALYFNLYELKKYVSDFQNLVSNRRY